MTITLGMFLKALLGLALLIQVILDIVFYMAIRELAREATVLVAAEMKRRGEDVNGVRFHAS